MGLPGCVCTLPSFRRPDTNPGVRGTCSPCCSPAAPSQHSICHVSSNVLRPWGHRDVDQQTRPTWLSPPTSRGHTGRGSHVPDAALQRRKQAETVPREPPFSCIVSCIGILHTPVNISGNSEDAMGKRVLTAKLGLAAPRCAGQERRGTAAWCGKSGGPMSSGTSNGSVSGSGGGGHGQRVGLPVPIAASPLPGAPRRARCR